MKEALDLDALEAVARKAPGEYWNLILSSNPAKRRDKDDEAAMTFIETIEPAVVLELIAEIRRLRDRES